MCHLYLFFTVYMFVFELVRIVDCMLAGTEFEYPLSMFCYSR